MKSRAEPGWFMVGAQGWYPILVWDTEDGAHSGRVVGCVQTEPDFLGHHHITMMAGESVAEVHGTGQWVRVIYDPATWPLGERLVRP